MTAILFGSIGAIAETSERQRQAFNQAFAHHGLDWHWPQSEYRALLKHSGGQRRIEAYAEARGHSVDAPAIHRSKSDLYQASLQATPLQPRLGVTDTIQAAKEKRIKLALVTTTSPENVAALLQALHPSVKATDFDLIIDRACVPQPKPASDAYCLTLETLNEQPGSCVAIEDNLDGLRAAQSAGISCVAFPGNNTANHDFSAAQAQVNVLSFSALQRFIP
ncbi:MAG: HAD-IA family hydrolase [Cyanobacteria bacterium P01_H01_bin.119]